jgi:histidine triad (HIT) family protein
VSNCLFCQIVAGREPASVIYEDSLAMVILDLFPVSDGHALVIARQHAAQLSGLDEGVSAHLLMLAEKLMAAQKRLDSSIAAHNLLVNDGKVANQHVPHVHLHVIPRRHGDNAKTVLSWTTRFIHRFNLQSRRDRLNRLAAALREQLQVN